MPSLRAACIVLLSSLCCPVIALAQSGDEVVAASAVYVRNDTNRTTVVSPRLRVAAPVATGTRADVTYTVDVWSSASVDIVSVATKRVTEQRDELDVSLSQALSDVTVTANYRYSREHDYTSNGGTLGASIDLAQKNTTVAASVTMLSDDVGRSGDPTFQRETKTVNARTSLTQVIDRFTLAQLVYEYGNMQGYLSSPYRYVGFGNAEKPSQGTCKGAASCQLEVNPDARTRHAIALRGRRALGDSWSVGGGYRFYTDDWDLDSHTFDVDAAWVMNDAWMFGGDLRYYTQGKASHFQPRYSQLDKPQLFTSDKELSPMDSTRLGLRVVRTWTVDDAGSRLRNVLSGAYTYYTYDEFLLVQAISAFELTLALEYLL